MKASSDKETEGHGNNLYIKTNLEDDTGFVGLTAQESLLINSTIDLREKTVSDAMIPAK